MAQKKSNNQPFNPKKYIKEAARKVPIHQILSDYETEQREGLSHFFVIRKKLSGNYILGTYLVDTLCLGLKQTGYHVSLSEGELADYMDNLSSKTMRHFQPIDPNLAFNVIYGAIEYAEDLGFQVRDKDFDVTEYILDDVETLTYIDIAFGFNGRPRYVNGPFDDERKILATLNKNVGEGNYDFVNINPLKNGAFYMDDDSFEDDEDEDNDNDEPHLPMIGFDFTLKKGSAIDFRYDDFLRMKRNGTDLTIIADEVILNEILEFNEEDIEIITYLLEKYSIDTKQTNLYMTIPLEHVAMKKNIITTKLLKKDSSDTYIIETILKYDDFLAHFPLLQQFEDLKKLIEKSPMLQYANKIIKILNQLPVLKKQYTIEPFIVYGEREHYGENEDHISIGFTIEKI